jgi:hypothetical protein
VPVIGEVVTLVAMGPFSGRCFGFDMQGLAGVKTIICMSNSQTVICISQKSVKHSFRQTPRESVYTFDSFLSVFAFFFFFLGGH